jgi:3-polyprenyl-4-hydroxybenzoate decarboxylase
VKLADVLNYATSEIALGSKLGIDATKKLPGESFKRPCPARESRRLTRAEPGHQRCILSGQSQSM